MNTEMPEITLNDGFTLVLVRISCTEMLELVLFIVLLIPGGDIIQNHTIKKIADKNHKTASQIILRWHYQLGTIPIPKSSTPSRQLENISIFDFELDENDMKAIAELTQTNS